MHPYNFSDYRYLLDGFQDLIESGRNKVSHLSLGNGFEFHENLLLQIGEANGKHLVELIKYAESLVAETSKNIQL